MKCLRVFLLALVPFQFAQGQTWLPEPNVKSCGSFLKCEAGVSELSPSNRQKLEQLMKTVPAQVSIKEINERLGFGPFESGPILNTVGGAKTQKAMWSLDKPPARQAGEHIDVMFWNGKAVLLRWYEQGVFKQSAMVYYAK
jgi:hypothetical protein